MMNVVGMEDDLKNDENQNIVRNPKNAPFGDAGTDQESLTPAAENISRPKPNKKVNCDESRNRKRELISFEEFISRNRMELSRLNVHIRPGIISRRRLASSDMVLYMTDSTSFTMFPFHGLNDLMPDPKY